MICRVCGGRIADRDVLGGYDEHPYGNGFAVECTHAVCPECGSDELSEEQCCVECGEEVAVGDLTGGFCRYCMEEMEQTLEWIRSMLSPAQRRWMAEHPERL